MLALVTSAALALPASLIALDSTRDFPALDRLARRPIGRAFGLCAVPLLMLMLLAAIACLSVHS